MTPETRLQDILRRSADRVEPVTADAYEQVLELRRRFDRRRRTIAAGLAMTLLVALVGLGFLLDDPLRLGQPVAPAQQGVHTQAPNPFPAGAESGLNGEWQTAVLSGSELRSALGTSGVPSATAGHVLAGARHWVVQFTFSTTLVVETWDPARPIPSLEVTAGLVYRLAPHHRVVITPPRPTTRWLFSYEIVGEQLRLHYIGAHGQPAPLQTARYLAWSTAPFTLVR